jgi:hypothetical protein
MGLGEGGQRMAQYLKYCGDLPFGGTINTGEIIPPPKYDAQVAEGVTWQVYLTTSGNGLEVG